jgi:peptidoglycan hydrolase-like protein with peptidoglycan-binding domain
MVRRAALKTVIIAIAFGWASLAPGVAAAAGSAELKTEIDDFFHYLELSSNGVLHWEDADSFDVRDDGDGAVAVIVNGHFSLRDRNGGPKPLASITLDRIEVHRRPAGDNMIELVVALPSRSTSVAADGSETSLALKDATATSLIEQPGERQRGLSMTVAGARIEHNGGANWINFGPLNLKWKLARSDNGGWTAPIDFDLKTIEFTFPGAPLAGTVAHIAYAAEASGPSLAELDALRDQIRQLRDDAQNDPQAKARLLLTLLPQIFAAFSQSHGTLTVEGIAAQQPGGPKLLSLAKAVFDGSITGLGGDSAALRFSYSHDGLDLDQSLLPAAQVPRHVAVDFGLDDIAGAPLRAILEAASKGTTDNPADRQAAFAQLLGAAMQLNPVLRIHDVQIDFKDVGIDGNGVIKRAPPVPVGYDAMGDVLVRGFDALPEVVTSSFGRAMLPLLKFLCVADKGADGAPVIKFHLASAIGKTLTINGNNVSAWFGGPPLPPGRRILRLADPFMNGDDVRLVQRVVKPNQVEPFTDSVYDTATALAVARFQKQAGIDVSGVVDAATREKLGLPEPPRALPLAPAAPKN